MDDASEPSRTANDEAMSLFGAPPSVEEDHALFGSLPVEGTSETFDAFSTATTPASDNGCLACLLNGCRGEPIA